MNSFILMALLLVLAYIAATAIVGALIGGVVSYITYLVYGSSFYQYIIPIFSFISVCLFMWYRT